MTQQQRQVILLQDPSTIEKKMQAYDVDKLSSLLKDFTVSQLCGKNGMRSNQPKLLKEKEISMTVLKFGPMLRNSLMASSLAKVVQLFKHFPMPQPTAVKKDDTICSNNALTEPLGLDLKKEEKQLGVVFEKKRVTNAEILPPAITQNPAISLERPPILLPPMLAALPEISNPKPMKITPIMSWGCEDVVQVQHQKQTSSQLLHFLRAKAKNSGALEVTDMEWIKIINAQSSPQPMSPLIKTQSYQCSQVMTDGLIDSLAPKKLHTDIENYTPVFRVKRVESSRSLTYTCVIATKTELWDIGEIFTEIPQGNSKEISFRNENCRDTTAQVEKPFVDRELKIQTRLCTDPVHKTSSAGEKLLASNNTTFSEFQVRRFEETEVVVSHIISPGNFYIQHADSILKLQALITDSWKASLSYAEQNCIPDIGTHVMGWFPLQEQWCRSQVTKICGVSRENSATDGAGSETSIKVEVKRMDYGDNACLSLAKIKDMTPEMMTLPLQAARVSLTNVSPVNGSDWSEEAVGWFQAMVHNRTLYARLYPQGPRVEVELFLEKGKLGAMRRGASLSLRLAQNGHANHKKLKTVAPMKRSAVHDKMREQASEWEKYLIHWYTQSKE